MYNIFVRNVENVLQFLALGLNISLPWKHGHIYQEWKKAENILYTRFELVKLHRSIRHSSARKFFKLLKLADPWKTDSQTRQIPEEIKKYCRNCQRFTSLSICYNTSSPTEENVYHSEEHSMDLVFLEGKALLLHLDTTTGFSAATFLDSHGGKHGQSVEGVLLSFVMSWCSMYTGYFHRLRADEGSIFMSARLKPPTDMHGIQLRRSEIRTHSSLGVGERYQEPLRRLHWKILFNHPKVPTAYTLRGAVKAVNETIGERELVPSGLALRNMPDVLLLPLICQGNTNWWRPSKLLKRRWILVLLKEEFSSHWLKIFRLF